MGKLRKKQKGGEYTVKSGDAIYKIAKKYNMSPSELMALNPQINEKGDIRPGQKIITEAPSKSLFDNFNLPSGKKAVKEVLQNATGINALDAAGLIPTNLKAFAADLTGLGREEGISEKDLTKREKKALREAIKRAEEQGKNYLEYKDFGSSANPYDDTGGGTFLQGFAPITKYFDPKYSMKTTLGQSTFKKNKDGTYTVSDEFDFNDASGRGFEGMIADTKAAPGISKVSPYRILRSVARNFGSAPGEGMDVNINLKQDEYQDGGMRGMMKAKIAMENQFGNNPAITRMIKPTDKSYNFGDGRTGTHHMGSYGKFAIPNIQDVDGTLQYTGPRKNEAIKFDRVEDATYFAKNYKDVAPALRKKQEGGKYQAGGLATPPMYGANTIPGSPETAAITYQEADKARVKALEQELEETRTSTKYMDEAEANMAKQQATIDSIEQSLGQGVEKAEELGVFDKLKARGASKKGSKYLEKLGEDGVKQLAAVGTKASADEVSNILASQVLPEAGAKAIETTGQNLTGSLYGLGQNQAMNFGQQTAQNVVATGADDLVSGAAGAGASAGKGLVGGIGPGGIGAIASLAGEGIKMASDDQDATTMNTGETIGSGLSGVGTGIGAAMTTAALMGSSLGPLGTAAGAIGGAVYGLGKGLISRGKARREMNKAEKKKERDEQKIATAQKLEALKSRMYSGYDMGADIARYGGYYQTGGVQMPGMLQNMASKRMATPMSAEDKTRYGSLQMQRDAADYLAKEGTMAGFKGPEKTGTLAKTGKFIAKEALLDKAFHGLGRFAGLPGLMLSPMEAGASTVRDPYGVPMRKPVVKNRNGGVKLPGGVAKPIPGSDAIEFKGRSHEQGGIMIDPNTEVEGDETMDKVTMKNGGKNDYFFSQHLKLGGKSFAQRHKDLLKNGGTQGEIDYLAKLQEEKAGRDPDDVKLGAGGYKMYDNGGIMTRSPFVTAPFDQSLNMSNMVPQAEPTREQINHENMINKGFEYNMLTGTYTKPSEEPESEPAPVTNTPVTNNATEERVPDENFEFNFIEPKPIPVPDKMVYDPNKVDAEKSAAYDNLPQEDKNVIDKANSGQELTDLEKKALKRLNRDVPGLAIAAGVGQLIAPAYAFFKKDRVAEQMGAPGRIKAPALDRVNYNAERASNAAQNRAISRSIDTSGAGPAGIMAKMASYRQKQEGDIKIAAAESRANIGIANQEAQMQMQANARNVANAMQADQINTQLRERQLAANEDRKLGAVDSFTERTAGLAGDLMSYKATERLARATGDMGIYERDRLRNFLKNQVNPRTGQPYTNADIAELFNKRFGEVQATNEPKEKDDEQV